MREWEWNEWWCVPSVTLYRSPGGGEKTRYFGNSRAGAGVFIQEKVC